MDSDDCALPERLERQVAEFERRPSLVCLGSAVLEIDPDGWPITPVQFALDHETIGADLMQGGALRFPTVMMRRDHALQVGGFRQPFSIGEDLDMFLRLFEVGELANLPDVLLRYRQHLHSISHALGRHWPLYRDAILGLARERRNGGKDALQRGEAVELPRWTRSEVDPLWVYDQWARNALSAGNVQTARKYARRALREAPTSIASWKLVARVLLGHRGSVPT